MAFLKDPKFIMPLIALLLGYSGYSGYGDYKSSREVNVTVEAQQRPAEEIQGMISLSVSRAIQDYDKKHIRKRHE